MMKRKILFTAALSGALSVALGAFGAHGLKQWVSAYGLEIWQKGVDYQFYHTLALLFLGLYTKEQVWLRYAYLFFVAGMLLFSGSLYLLTIDMGKQWGISGWIGPVTPIGGLCLIGGWGCLMISALKGDNVLN